MNHKAIFTLFSVVNLLFAQSPFAAFAAPVHAPVAPKQAFLQSMLSPNSDKKSFDPIRCVVAQAGGGTTPIHTHTLGNDGSVIKYASRTSLAVEESGLVNLSNGEVLVYAIKPTNVKCGDYLVSLNASSLAFISNDKGVLKVCNVWEQGQGTVNASINKQSVAIAAGQELIIGASNGVVTGEVKSDPVARRRVRVFDISNKCAIARSEVSIISLIQSNNLLAQMMKSEDPGDRQLTEKMIKMAACLAQTTANHGPYTQIGQ